MSGGSKIKSEARFEGCPVTETSAGMPVKATYGPGDTRDLGYSRDVGEPGEYPFVRGIWKDMYRGKLWTRRVFTGLGSASDTNKRYKFLIEHGETGLYCFGDTITHMGIDPDHPMAKGYAGVSGVSLVCLRDMYELFEGISLEDISVSFNNPSMAAAVIYAAFVTAAEDMGYDLGKLSGSILNEPIHLVHSMYDVNARPLELSARVATDVIEYSVRHTPRWHPIAPNAYDMHEKGANAVQEMAFTIAIMMEYIRRMLQRGYDIDQFAPRVNLLGCACDIDLFEEVAKFRAARKVWARLMRERYGAKSPQSWRLYLSAHTSGHSLTRAQPVNNIVRVTLESLACVLGGLQSFDPAGYDEGYYVLTEDSALTSLNIHNILAYEARVANTADPLGGSYYIESLTRTMEERMWATIEEMERMGGAIKATESGWMRDELERELIKEQSEVRQVKRVVVGLNRFVVPEEQEVPIRVGRDRPLEEQIATSEKREREIVELRSRRDQGKARRSLEGLRAASGEGINLVEPLRQALRADVTLGEALGAIRLGYGASYDPFGMVESPF
ncbi:MAG: methylmalonyl-CoA mutase family protein [Chloroflexota bacterium]